jgi:hypothetical protein
MSHVLQVPVMYLYSAVSHHVCWHNGSLGSEEFDTTVILWHPPELHDFHKWMNEHTNWFSQVSESDYDYIQPMNIDSSKRIEYNSSLPLLKQSNKTKQAIISLFG